MRRGWNHKIYNVVTLQNTVSFKVATQYVDRSCRTARRRSVATHRPYRLLILIIMYPYDALTAHSLSAHRPALPHKDHHISGRPR